MADSGIGFDRSIDTTGYSPLASGAGDRGFADRPHRAGTPGAGRDGSAQDLASLIKLGTLKLETGNEAEATEFFRKVGQPHQRGYGFAEADDVLDVADWQQFAIAPQIGGAPCPARTKCIVLVRFGLRLVRGDQLLLQLRRRRLVVAELEIVRTPTRGDRLETRREMLELGERSLGRDLHQPRSRRVGSLDLAAVSGELARDVTHLRFWRFDLDVDDRL